MLSPLSFPHKGSLAFTVLSGKKACEAEFPFGLVPPCAKFELARCGHPKHHELWFSSPSIFHLDSGT